jgi:hypothetical protein
VANGTEDVVLVSRETLALVTSTVEGVVLLPEISIPKSKRACPLLVGIR